MIKLFEVENNVVKPTEHCHTIRWLRAVQNNWPDEALKIYAYIFYMSCPSQENPYFNLNEELRQGVVLDDLELSFDIVEEDQILECVNKAVKMYETPTVRAYKGIKTMLDNLTDYMGQTTITAGRDGNINSLIRAAKDFDGIRQSFKGVAKDLEAEQETVVRGGQNLSYDQM